MSNSSPLRGARVIAPLLAGISAALTTAPAQPASTILCPGHWKKVANEGPPGRNRHAMAYDSARERVVMFGGLDESTGARLGDTWEWDGERWQLAAVTGPSPRAHTSLAYDTTLRHVLLFGGVGTPADPNGVNNDTWQWDGVAWQDVSGSNKRPAARNGMGMAYDTLHRKMVMHGGGVPFGRRFGDTWTRDATDWHRRLHADGFGDRIPFDGMAFDRELGLTIEVSSPEASCEQLGTWTWDGHVWSPVTGAPPSPRYSSALAYDSARHRVVLHGGDGCPHGVAWPTDTWEWDGADWQLVDTTGMGGRQAPMTYDRRRGQVILFGGFSTNNPQKDDTWAWSGPTYRCDVYTTGDINCDGIVDIDDRKMVDAGQGHAACAADDTRDLDGDGRITSADKAALVELCTFADCARGPGDTDRD
jgi:hypothetical protein